MTAFALVSDIEARWRDLSTTEETRASVLLDDASAMLSSLVDVDPNDSDQSYLLKVVCCNMVIRAMSASESDMFGVSQASMTAGPYSQSFNYANPSGDMYLTRNERRLLGVESGFIGSIEPEINGYYGGNV